MTTDGTLVSIEGIDGSGKSTLIENLLGYYPTAFTTTEPQEDQWLGRVTRDALSDEDVADMAMFFLFLAEHAQHVRDYIEPALNEDRLVITDRYIDSRYAYQTTTIEDHIDVSAPGWIRSIQEAGWSQIPDVTIVLDLPVETAMERLDGDEVYEKHETLEAVREEYLGIADAFDRCHVVNALRDPEVVATECAGHIENAL